MDNYDSFGISMTSRPSRKRRSNLYRRPLNESSSPQECFDSVSLASTPSDHVSDAPGVNIAQASFTNLSDTEKERGSIDVDGVLAEADNFKTSVEDNPTSWKSLKLENGAGTGNRFNKVKLKVGGVTRTIHTRTSDDDSSGSRTSLSKSTPSDMIYPLSHKLSRRENVDPHFMDVQGGLRGMPWKDFSKTGFSFGKADSLKLDLPKKSVKKHLVHGSSSKTKSTYLLDEDDDDEDDDEIRYLQKLKTSKIASSDNTDDEEDPRGKKLRKISKVMDRRIDGHSLKVVDYGSSRPSKERKRSGSLQGSEDTDYMEGDESESDGEIEHENKKRVKEPIDVAEYSKTESSITTRRRAILTGTKYVTAGLGASPIQFPDGLPPAPPRKPKEQLTEMEQQLKRAEAAQRRKIRNEKAAQESEAEVIRKILGQDSTRKRREEKIRKRQEELAQERNANAGTVPSSVVRWVMGPSGTIITFPDDVGLPSIFEPKPCRYPPPREKCAGPSCTNAYKYRDSKSELPLCSLECYKAIREKLHSLPTC